MKIDSEAVKINLIGGWVCLDFTNTVGGRTGSKASKRARDHFDTILSEKLGNYTDLVAWSRYVGLLNDKETLELLRLAEKRTAEAEAVLQRAITLREAIYRIFEAAVRGRQPEKEDLDKLNRELAVAKDHEWLIHTREGFTWEWKDRISALDYTLWVVASSAAELLTCEDLARVRQCVGENCGWLFADTSRNRTRQWCDMRVCGNLAKVRRFRRRKKE